MHAVMYALLNIIACKQITHCICILIYFYLFFVRNVVPLSITLEQQAQINASPQCHICKKNFTENESPVTDHCHLTGKIRVYD